MEVVGVVRIKSVQRPARKKSLKFIINVNMAPKKSICAVQEKYKSCIEDSPDSPVSSADEHVPCWDEGPETVYWSNAAFRTSLSSSTCSNQDEGFSPRNSLCRDLVYRDSQNAAHSNNPIHCFFEKSVSVNICRGNLSETCAQGCSKMIKVEAQLNSPVMEQSLPHKSTSPPESKGKNRTMSGLNNGMFISEEEMKIKADLEKEIEKALEEEIKDGILILTHRLAQLHARQKDRKGERQYHTPEFDTPLKSYNNALQDSWCGSILYPKLPMCVGAISPLVLSSSCREIKSSAFRNECRHFKSPGYPIDPEKKFQKDFDWVRTLRSKANLNSPKKPNHSLAGQARLRNDSPRFSHALFPEPNNEKRRSTSEPRCRCQRHGCQCVHNTHSFPKEDSELPLHGKVHAKLSPKDELCSPRHIHTTHGAVSRNMVSRKGNDAVEEAKSVGQAEGKPKENRLFLIDMMNKLKASDAYNVGEQSKKRAFSRNQPSPSKDSIA